MMNFWLTMFFVFFFFFISQPSQYPAPPPSSSSSYCKNTDSYFQQLKFCFFKLFIPLSDIIGVRKIYSRIDSNNKNARSFCCLRILLYVSVQISPRNLAKQCSSWPCDLQKNFGERYYNLQQKTISSSKTQLKSNQIKSN